MQVTTIGSDLTPHGAEKLYDLLKQQNAVEVVYAFDNRGVLDHTVIEIDADGDYSFTEANGEFWPSIFGAVRAAKLHLLSELKELS